MKPSEFPEIQNYPEIVNFLKLRVDMLFEDIRTLLRLPFDDLVGCNFTTAAMLFNIIAGFSVCFYNASIKAIRQKGDRGKRFKELLIKYYPWQNESISPKEGSELLYSQTRNPLANSLGLDVPLQTKQTKKNVVLAKDTNGLTLKKIDELELSHERPKWLPQTFCIGSNEIRIFIPTLYWGLHRLLHKFFADKEQIEKAEKLIKQLNKN